MKIRTKNRLSEDQICKIVQCHFREECPANGDSGIGSMFFGIEQYITEYIL